MIALRIFELILLTDFITGAVHWREDCYGNPNWKPLGKRVVIPNIEHHTAPRKFLIGSTLERIRLSAIIAFMAAIIFWLTIGLNWQIVFVLVYAAFANEIHAITHRTDQGNGKFICMLQEIGLIQSRRMHGLHHTSPFNVNYCVMTNYLNPVLNLIGFWERLEKVISWFGIRPMRNAEVRVGV